MNVPDVIHDVLSSAGTSDWLRNALRSALEGDVISARNDAVYLLVILDAHLEQFPREEPEAVPAAEASEKREAAAFPSSWVPPMAQLI